MKSFRWPRPSMHPKRLCMLLPLCAATATATGETCDHRRVQSPVKDQGARGVCAAFAVNAALETLTGFPHDLSEQLLLGVTRLTRDDSPPGSDQQRRPRMEDGLRLSDYRRALETHGVTYEGMLPFDRRGVVMSKDLEEYLPPGDREAIARALYRSTPLSPQQRRRLPELGKYKVGRLELVDYSAARRDARGTARAARIAAADEKLREYLSAGGLDHHAIPASYLIHRKIWADLLDRPDIPVITLAEYPFDVKSGVGHAVTIVGFTTDVHDYAPGAPRHLEGQGFWIIKNSWGTGWGGLGGYGLVSYAYHDICVDEALLVGRHGVAEFRADAGGYDNSRLTTNGDLRLKVQPIRRSKIGPGGERELVEESLFLSTYLLEPTEANLTTVKYIVDYRPGDAAADGTVAWEATARIVSPRLQVRSARAPDRSFRFRPWSEPFAQALERVLRPPPGVETRLELSVVAVLYEREPNFLNVVRGARRYRTVVEGGHLQSHTLRPVDPGGVLDLATAEKLLAEAEGR